MQRKKAQKMGKKKSADGEVHAQNHKAICKNAVNMRLGGNVTH
jgi:hypothetical protein